MKLFKKLDPKGVTILQMNHPEKNAAHGKRTSNCWMVKEFVNYEWLIHRKLYDMPIGSKYIDGYLQCVDSIDISIES